MPSRGFTADSRSTGFRIPNSFFSGTWISDSNCSWDLGSLSCVPDSKKKNTPAVIYAILSALYAQLKEISTIDEKRRMR